jgi:hypothetical protein
MVRFFYKAIFQNAFPPLYNMKKSQIDLQADPSNVQKMPPSQSGGKKERKRRAIYEMSSCEETCCLSAEPVVRYSGLTASSRSI